MNVLDHLKQLSIEEIKDYCHLSTIPASAAMLHIAGDFNLGSLVRAANFFALKEVYYVGGKKSFDRRSAVGTHHYTPMHYINSEEEFLSVVSHNTLVCIENNVPKYSSKTFSIFDEECFSGLIKPIFLFGEEQRGIPDSFLEKSERIITIPSFGSVRSLNVSSCASTVFAFYKKYYDSNK